MLPVFFLVLASISVVTAQDPVEPESVPLHISSLNTSFGVRGEFTGQYQTYSNSVKVTFTRSFILVSEDCPYKGRRYVDGIRVGLVTFIDDKKWKSVSWSKEHLIEKVMKPGDQHELGEIELSIPLQEVTDLSNHWLAIEIEDITLDVPEPQIRSGSAYAHSVRNIFKKQ
jgi:hypothetical protein